LKPATKSQHSNGGLEAQLSHAMADDDADAGIVFAPPRTLGWHWQC
jgi:hypothetical protein